MTKSVLHQILDRAGFSPVTKHKYGLVIDRWVEFAGADPAGWTRDRAQDFYDQLIEGGLKVQSANIYMGSLRYVSKWYATKSGAVDFAVVQRQRGNKGKTRRAESDEAPILTDDEVRALLETCREGSPLDLRDLTLMVVGLETGMRRMSLRGTTFESISIAKGAYPIATVPIKGPGGEETFPVPLSDTAHRALTAWMTWLRSHRLIKGALYRRLTPRLIHGERTFEPGDVLSLTGINELVEARSKAAGIRHVNPHLFRHTFISWREQAGLSPLDISAITGHKVQIVAVDGVHVRIGEMRTYMHKSAEDIERIRNSTPPWLAQLVGEILSS